MAASGNDRPSKATIGLIVAMLLLSATTLLNVFLGNNNAVTTDIRRLTETASDIKTQIAVMGKTLGDLLERDLVSRREIEQMIRAQSPWLTDRDGVYRKLSDLEYAVRSNDKDIEALQRAIEAIQRAIDALKEMIASFQKSAGDGK